MPKIELFNKALKVDDRDQKEILDSLAHHGAVRLGYPRFEKNSIPVLNEIGVQKEDDNQLPRWYSRGALAKKAIAMIIDDQREAFAVWEAREQMPPVRTIDRKVADEESI